MALTTAQRNTVRNAFITLATNNPGYMPTGMTASQWADAELAQLDAFRAQTEPRSYYTLRWAPFLLNRVSLTAAIRSAIDNHVNGL